MSGAAIAFPLSHFEFRIVRSPEGLARRLFGGATDLSPGRSPGTPKTIGLSKP